MARRFRGGDPLLFGAAILAGLYLFGGRRLGAPAGFLNQPSVKPVFIDPATGNVLETETPTSFGSITAPEILRNGLMVTSPGIRYSGLVNPLEVVP